MAISMNRPLVGINRPMVPAFAQKSAASKVAQGWTETVKDLPSEAVDKLKRTAHVIANPIDSAKEKWAEIKANPKKALVPIAMMAGGAALSAISPGLMRYVGLAMTASMVVIPTVKFAKSQTEDELMAIADGTSKQLVNTAASYATSWAAGKVIRYGMDKLKGNGANVGSKVADGGPDDIQAEGKLGVKEVMDRQAEGSSVDPDAINFRAVRNDREAGHAYVTELRQKVADFHFNQVAKQNPGLTRPDFDAWLKTDAARPLRLQMVQDVRGAVHHTYLKLHGIQVQDGMKMSDLVGVRKYVQDIPSTYDLADAVKGINVGLTKGITDGGKLGIEAERYLYGVRGVAAHNFGRLEKLSAVTEAGQTTNLAAQDLKKLRNFADAFATQQSGKYLTVAAQRGTVASVDGLRSIMIRQLATDFGLIVPKTGVEDKTLLTLVSNIGDEDQRNAKELIRVANEAFKNGKGDYLAIHEQFNRNLLKGLGADEKVLAGLGMTDDAIKAVQPEYPAALTRAEQVQLLRDRLRVLPEAQRTEAIAALQSGKANLMNFDTVLAGHFEGQVAKLAGNNAGLATQMLSGMTEQQKANFVSDLSGLPADVRARIFAGLTGSADEMNKAAAGRLTALIEQKFGVKVHNTAKKFPVEGWGEDPYTKEWSVQGASELFNGLNKMARNGTLPAELKGTTFINLDGSDPAGPGLVPFTLGRPKGKPLMHYTPGAAAYQGGTMGYRFDQGGKEFVVLYDDAMKMSNANRTPGFSRAEGTVIHEAGHAVQMGGDVSASEAAQMLQEQKLVKEWSALSNWREADGSLSDGYYEIGGKPRRYYKDPSVQLGDRPLVVSDYGATDSVEDFAEFSRVFFHDPQLAMETSPEKFLYLNQMYGNPYSAQESANFANQLGLGMDGLQKALGNMRAKIKGVPGQSLAAPSLVQRLATAVLGRKAS